MSWRLPHLGVFIAAGLALLIAAVFSRSEVQADNVTRTTLSVEDLRESTVIGHIGVPLGKVVKVTGRVVEDARPIKGRDGKSVLQIETVDGQRLRKPVEFWHEDVDVGIPGRQSTRDKIIQPGSRIQLAVYESGRFVGWPKDDSYRPVPQTHGFGFRSQLIIVHDFQHPANSRPVRSPSPKSS